MARLRSQSSVSGLAPLVTHVFLCDLVSLVSILILVFPGFPSLLTFLSVQQFYCHSWHSCSYRYSCHSLRSCHSWKFYHDWYSKNFCNSWHSCILAIPCFSWQLSRLRSQAEEVQEVRESTERQESQKKQENMTPHRQLLAITCVWFLVSVVQQRTSLSRISEWWILKRFVGTVAGCSFPSLPPAPQLCSNRWCCSDAFLQQRILQQF